VKITDEVSETLKSYVYVYIDPRDGKPFYIGKGKGNRIFSHLEDQSETEKVYRISEIRQRGLEPRIDLLRYGLTDTEAVLVEAAAIDLIGKANLANKVAGYHSRTFGRITSQELIIMVSAKEINVKHRAILITINKMYRSDMTSDELYEATRGVWVVGPRRENAQYAMAVYQGIVREVYRISKWYPAGTLEYKYRDQQEMKDNKGRWEFEGEIAYDIRDQYVNYSVGKGGQNPIRYVNC
jgi:hypothetical protein